MVRIGIPVATWVQIVSFNFSWTTFVIFDYKSYKVPMKRHGTGVKQRNTRYNVFGLLRVRENFLDRTTTSGKSG